MTTYTTFAGFENAPWVFAIKKNQCVKLPSKKALKLIFNRCLRNAWHYDAESIFESVLDGSLPKAFNSKTAKKYTTKKAIANVPFLSATSQLAANEASVLIAA